MKSIPVQTLRPQGLVSGTAFLDEGFILLGPDTPVSPTLLQLLSAWGYREVLSNDDLTATAVPEADASDQPFGILQDDAEDAQSRAEAQKFYSGLLEFTHRLFETYLSRGTIAVDPLTLQVRQIGDMLRKHRRFLLRLAELDRSGFGYTVSHSVNVALLAVAVGDSLKLPPFRLIELGMAGLLHEIGMFKLPNTFQNANRPLTETEKRALSAHPILGYRVLRELGFPPNVTLAVLEHHEKEDGSGYPQGLSRDRIAMSAKILAVASAYDAQITSRPFRAARNGHASLLELMRESRKSYDEQILRRLIFLLSLYPIGSIIELKSGVLAVVHDTNPEDARHPEVRLLTSETRSPLSDYPLIRLSDRPDFEVKRVLNSDEVRQLRADKIIPA